MSKEAENVEWNNSILIFIWTKTLFICLSSSICVVLNSFLVAFIAVNKEFRNLKFSPVVFQAVADIIGPGVANFVYELRLLDEALKENRFMGLSRFIETNTSLRLFTYESCFLNFLRIILNEYTTGFCVLAVAFIRYALVCHPTRECLVNRLCLIIILGVLIVIAFISLCANAIHVFWSRPEMSNENYWLVDDYWLLKTTTLIKCDALLTRRSKRLIIEALTCFAIPAILSGEGRPKCTLLNAQNVSYTTSSS